MADRTPWLAEDAQPTTVVVKPRWFDDPEPIEVTLRPQPTGDGWEVYQGETWLGTVRRYEGRLDLGPIARGSRISRGQGKRRTLWSSQGANDTHAWDDRYSRAECIRSLVGA